MKNKIFIAVNYGTSYQIKLWRESIVGLVKDPVFIVVDNYKDSAETNFVETLSKDLDFILLKSSNVGYGRALNIAFDYIKENYQEAIVFAGNLDLHFKKIPENFPDGDYVFLPKVLEGVRNRNPFLTRFQKRFLFLHLLPINFNSPFLLMLNIYIFRILSWFPSSVWAVHGSLFCFDIRLLTFSRQKVFNEKSFLYAEELEFAMFIEGHASILPSEVTCEHIGGVCTGDVVKSRKDFFNIWKPSMENWFKRWK